MIAFQGIIRSMSRPSSESLVSAHFLHVCLLSVGRAQVSEVDAYVIRDGVRFRTTPLSRPWYRKSLPPAPTRHAS